MSPWKPRHMQLSRPGSRMSFPRWLIACAACMALTGVGHDAGDGSLAAAGEEAADLVISARSGNSPQPGAWRLTFEISITNHGPARAHEVLVEAVADERVRKRLRNVRIQGDAGLACRPDAMLCGTEALPAGAEARLRLTAEMDRAGGDRSAGFEFRVASSTVDRHPCDNRYYSTTFLGTDLSP